MIVVWPLITSKTINPNILQGVCKALEKYVFIHRLDTIIERANENIKKKNKKRSQFLKIEKMFGKRVLKLENVNFDNIDNIDEYISENIEEYIVEAGRGPTPKKPPTNKQQKSNKNPKSSSSKSPKSNSRKSPKSSSSKTPKQKGSNKTQSKAPKFPTGKGGEAKTKEREGIPDKIIPQTPQIGKMDVNVLSNEPTWQQVTDQEGRVTAIGVKVVPFIMNNDQSLLKLLNSDRYRKGMDIVVQKQSRKVLRFMFRLANYTWKKTAGLFSWTGLVSKSLKKGSLSQEWKSDIILQNTSFGKDMFILLNKIDLEEDFSTDAKGVNKLFGLGWTSFLVADDINKTVSFCMNTYKGMCSILNYSFLYADSRSASNVYKDIEDVRKSAGPLFRLNRRKKAMITDDLAQNKLDQYSQRSLISESYLNEGIIPDIIKQIKNDPKKLANNIKGIASAVKRQDLKLAYKISKNINPGNKKTKIHKVIDQELKTNAKFKKNYDLSYRVFKNSINGLPEDILKVGSALISSLSLLSKDKNYNIKNDLKKIVMKTRAKAGETQYDKDVKIAFIFALIFVVFTGPLTIWLGYMIASWVGIGLSAIASNIIPFIAIACFVYVLRIFAAKEETKAAVAKAI